MRQRRPRRIAKADLRSEMVGEFPELQGLMGRYYALAAGRAEAVADAARDHWAPLGEGDDVPTAPVSVAVALADKIDTLTGFWAIDEKPTGSKDPFALRRAALGVIRLVLENECGLLGEPSLLAPQMFEATICTCAIAGVAAESRRAATGRSMTSSGRSRRSRIVRSFDDWTSSPSSTTASRSSCVTRASATT